MRLLQAELPAELSDAWLKNYLFRIATNLARDQHRKKRQEPLTDEPSASVETDLQHDVSTCLGRIKPKERELLWLAYVERFSHEEIAAIVGAKARSIRVMLARARQNFGEILKGAGL